MVLKAEDEIWVWSTIYNWHLLLSDVWVLTTPVIKWQTDFSRNMLSGMWATLIRYRHCDSDYRHTDSEVNWEELEWLTIIKYIIVVSKLSPISLAAERWSPVGQ